MNLPIMTLLRVHSNMYRTFGVLMDQRGPFALTLENPWENNKPNVSCIPVGTYICDRIHSPKYGDTYEIKKVPGRSHILFHWGNFERDTKGCILIGEEFGVLDGSPVILSSKRGFREFLERLRAKSRFILEIQEAG